MGGLPAWFGFPHAQEEAPRRALAAALAIRGEMLLRLSPAQAHEAESCFRRALDIAEQQGAHLLMRRAHDSLARLHAREP